MLLIQTKEHDKVTKFTNIHTITNIENHSNIPNSNISLGEKA